jgi:GTP cyclohydrolase IB
MEMKDVQNSPDSRNIDLERVGIRGLFLPLDIKLKGDGYQRVLAKISLSADLPGTYRGTHMSRYIENLNRWSRQKISSAEIKDILWDMRIALYARRVEISLEFKYFVPKTAPVSGQEVQMDYNCLFRGIQHDEDFIFLLGVEVPVHLVCPCSKEIADYGAHNQRALLRVLMEYYPEHFIWLEDLIALLESQGSSAIYPLLKRADEKYVTEHAFENPKFVEDVVRDVVVQFRADSRIRWYEVECLSAESLHTHDAFAHHREEKEPDRGRGAIIGSFWI